MLRDNVIEMKHVTCKIGNKYLLNDINWTVKTGEHWVVFGMNGSGKTTLLSIVAGFKQYTPGTMKLFAIEPSNENILEMRKNIGWVSASFFDKYYMKEFVMDIVLSGKFGTLGINGEITLKDRKRAKDLLLELGLGRQIDYTFDMLSKGERESVLIARALFSRPRILVLDEPCTGLDICNRELLFKTLEKLACKEDLTIIYVTHYVEEIKPLFKKCLLLKNGHIFLQGDTKEIFNSEVISDYLENLVQINYSNDGQLQLNVVNVVSNIAKFFE